MKFIYDSAADVPDALKTYYAEKDSKWVLQCDGAVAKSTVDEFRNTNIALTKERDGLLLKFKDVDPSDYASLRARAEELDEGKLIKKEGLEAAVTARVAKMKEQMEAQIGDLTSKLGTATVEMGKLKIDQALVARGTAAGLRPEAITDFVSRGRSVFSLDAEGNVIALEGDGKTKRFGATGTMLSIDEFVGDSVKDKTFSHLFAPSQGGGAAGGGRPGTGTAANPWKSTNRNLTQQAAIMRENPEMAARMKAEATAGA